MIRKLVVLLVVTSTPAAASPRLLTPGTFHGDEVAAVTGDRYWALLTDGGRSRLESRTVEVRQVWDPILDEEGQQTGKEVTTSGRGEPVALIAGVALSPGPVATAVAETQVLLPGSAVSFEFEGRRYVLAARAAVEYSPHGEALYSDYELVLTDGRTEQVLLEHESLDGEVPSLLWAGDLDRDGKLDLLLDATRHYNLRQPTLFLSAPSPRDALVEEVAFHRSVGC
ncbi:MAG: hypothetical protein ACK4N5_08645 [Myxococcales bacterium]